MRQLTIRAGAEKGMRNHFPRTLFTNSFRSFRRVALVILGTISCITGTNLGPDEGMKDGSAHDILCETLIGRWKPCDAVAVRDSAKIFGILHIEENKDLSERHSPLDRDCRCPVSSEVAAGPWPHGNRADMSC